MSYVNDQTVAGSAVGRLFVTRHFDQSAKSTVGTMHMQIGGGGGGGGGSESWFHLSEIFHTLRTVKFN